MVDWLKYGLLGLLLLTPCLVAQESPRELLDEGMQLLEQNEIQAAVRTMDRAIALSEDPRLLVVAHSAIGSARFRQAIRVEPRAIRRRQPRFTAVMASAEEQFRKALEHGQELDLRDNEQETLRWNLASSLEWLGHEGSETRKLFSAVTTSIVAPDGSEEQPRLVTGEGMTKPIKLHQVPPTYTELARIARIEGQVVLMAIIDSGGEVKNLRVMKGLTGCTAQAIKAIRQWRFQPATLNGRPVPVFFNLTVTFELRR